MRPGATPLHHAAARLESAQHPQQSGLARAGGGGEGSDAAEGARGKSGPVRSSLRSGRSDSQRQGSSAAPLHTVKERAEDPVQQKAEQEDYQGQAKRSGVSR